MAKRKNPEGGTLDLSHETEGDVPIVVAKGSMDAAGVALLTTAIQEALAKSRQVVVDATGVATVSSSALALLVKVGDEAQQAKKSLLLVATGQLRDIVELLQLTVFFKTFSDRRSALASLERASGESVGPRVSFGPFKDFHASEGDLAGWKAITDPGENIERRFEFFRDQDPLATSRALGFVPLIRRHRFTCIGVPGGKDLHDLVYSVGLFYSFGFPEIMLRGDNKKATIRNLQPAIEAVGQIVAEESKGQGSPFHGKVTKSALDRRAERLAKIVHETCPGVGLTPDGVRAPDRAFLDEYAYGYGFYFYCHFLDTTNVPLLMALAKA